MLLMILIYTINEGTAMYSGQVSVKFIYTAFRYEINRKMWIMPTSSPYCMAKVKCTLVQPLRLCTGRTAHRRSRGIALPFHDHGTRRGWGVSVTPRPLFTPGKDPVPIVQEAGWAPGPVWTGAENLASTGIRSLDRPAHRSVAIPIELPGPQILYSL
jgi:hypothetical protein